MKKLLVLLALLMALTLLFVACKDPATNPNDTTVDDQATEEPTQGEDPTAEPTDPEETTEEPTEAPTQEPDTPAPTDDPSTPTNPPEPPTAEPETDDPMEPVNVFNAEDIQTVTGGDPNNMTQDCLTLEDGYVHVVPLGPDPYWYPFAGVDGARYVAIRYRTDATGADMQLYIGSTGGGPQDDSSMIRQPVIADGEWHVIIFDTQSLIDAEIYDGEYVSYFRFDPLEAGYMLDESGEPYKKEDGQWARYSLPEGCSIDVAYIGFFHSEAAVAKYDFEQYPPYAQPGEAGLKNASFDTFYVNNQMYFPEDGGADAKLDAINNTLVFNAASELQSIILRGWIGFDQAIDSFGYYVDNYEFVFDASFAKATEQGVIDAGGEFASRFEILVPLDYFEGDDHFVGFVVKLADGTIVQLREDITIDLPELPKDITDSFVSDVNSNEVGTTMDASDLANFFIVELPLAGSGVEANGDGKLYHMTSINDMYADVNGRYFFKTNVVDSNGAGWMFIRGYKVVNSDEIIEKFDPAGGIFKINNYYETDSASAMGGAGIYARLQGGKLFIMVKHYNPETITRVGNKVYFIEAAGSELTLADNGSKVSILVDGVTYATVELSGSKVYEDINEVQPKNGFAEKAVITLKDGTTETIENTLIADTCECQVGVVSRAGVFKFDALSVGGYSAIEVPALEIVTPDEPPVVDPDAPVLVLDPEFINSQALSTGGQTFTQHIGSSEIKTEGEVTFVRLTTSDGDPYVTLVNIGSMLELPPYMAFSYRTNGGLDAHVFIGSGTGWSGQGDVTSVAWNQDEQWNHTVLDLANCGLTSISNNLINYCRFDFFTGKGADGDYMDVEYVAFFNSAEAAEKYYNKLHGIETPTEPSEPETNEPETNEPETNEPETEEPKPEVAYKNETITLAERAGGGPFSGTKTFGQRYNIGENILKAITVENMATYDDGNVNTWSLKVWQWNTDYATTVAAEPLFVKLGENHKNNSHLSVLIEGVEIKGDFYYEVEYLTGSKQFTGWTAQGTVIEGLETYAGGALKDGHYASSIIIGIPYDPNAPVADITNKFESNVGANAEGTDIMNSDLNNYFTIVYGAAEPHQVASGMYQFGGINEMFAKADGLYAFSANIQGAVVMQDTLFVRGYHAVNFPENPSMLVNNYYEDDGDGSTGGSGIYVTIKGDVLYIVVKAFNGDKAKGIQNYIYQLPANGGTNVTIADDGKVVYVILEGNLMATVALSGETTYDRIVLPLDPGATFAQTAVVTLADGTTATVENTLVASTYISQFGIVARGGQINFWSTNVKGFSEIEIPEFPHIHSYESVVTDPTCTEDGYTTHTCASCGDSYTDTVVPAPGHNFNDGPSCGICGAENPDYVAPVLTPEEIVNAAYGLAEGATLEGTYTLTGVITSIDTAWSEQYSNISVWMQIGDMADKPILAFRLAGEGAATLKVGDTITVTGSLTNYYGKIEFAQGCTLDAVIPGPDVEPEQPDENSITIDFSDKANRTEFDTSKQVWANGEFILTNNKASSSNNVADYANPARFYAKSELVFTYAGMTKLVFNCDSTSYATALVNSISDTNATVTVSGMVVTVEFTTPVDSFTVTLGAQVRMDSVTAYVAPAEEPTPDEPTANEINVTTTDTYGYVDEYTFTASASGTYTFTLPAGLGLFTVEAYNNWGMPVIDFYDNAEGYTFNVALAEGAEYNFLVGALTKGDWTITYTFVEGEVGGDEPETPDEPEAGEIVLVVGPNSVTVSESLYTEGGFISTFVAEAEGTYTFAGDFLVRIYDANGGMVGTASAYLTAGTYELQVITAYLPGAGTYGLTVEFTAPEEPEEPDPEQPGGDSGIQDGTAENPYVITEFPLVIEGVGAHDLYYTFTATATTKIEIKYTEGGLISFGGEFVDWNKDEGGMMYALVVDAGQTVIINPWGNADATYSLVGGGK